MVLAPFSRMATARRLPFDFCKYANPHEGSIQEGLHGLQKTGVCLQNEGVLSRIFDAQNPFWDGNFKVIQNVIYFMGDFVAAVEPVI